MFHTYQCYVLEQSRACKCFIHTSVMYWTSPEPVDVSCVMYWNSPEPVNVSYIPVLCIGTVQSIHTSVMYWNSEPVNVSYIPVLCIGTVQSL